MDVVFQVDTLEREASEVLRLNMLAPINKIPPEILAFIPDFWNTYKRDRKVIVLTHVCRAWREVFVSRSSLWTNFDCLDPEKTRVYFERSKFSPINLSLDLREGIPSYNSLFQLIPHVTGRLKSVFIMGPLDNVEVDTHVISRLTHPAPLLEHLTICSNPSIAPDLCPALPPALFSGDLSSLRTLCLESVHTELPWRNMINLTSFILHCIPPGAVSVERILDFFENAPYLEEVEFCFTTLTAGAQNGRLVSLACLKSMCIEDDGPPPVLLDHLLIPAGAKLEIQADMLSSLIGAHLPRSFDNLKNLSNFTTIQLNIGPSPSMKFSGPNGAVKTSLPGGSVDLVLEFLAKLDTSKTEWFEIDWGHSPSGRSFYQALLRMKDLRTLTLSKCRSLEVFIRALQPATSPTEVVVCPKLEKLVLVLHPYEMMSHITSVIEMAAARALRGEKLRTVRIVGGRNATTFDVAELRKHVYNVERGSGA